MRDWLLKAFPLPTVGQMVQLLVGLKGTDVDKNNDVYAEVGSDLRISEINEHEIVLRRPGTGERYEAQHRQFRIITG